MHSTDKVERHGELKRRGKPADPWTPEALALLKDRQARGWSGNQIRVALAELNPPVYKSRNAIIGKIHRLALTKVEGEGIRSGLCEVNWTERMDEDLRTLVRAGHSQHATAAEMQSAHGKEGVRPFSTHIVAKRMRDLGLVSQNIKATRTRGGTYRRYPSAEPKRPPMALGNPLDRHQRKERTAALAPMQMAVEEMRPLVCEPVPMTEATEKQCHWPASSDARGMLVCGGPIKVGSYCGFHANAGFRQMPTKGRNASYRKRQEFDIVS